jgi:hypothetical protein
MTTLSAFLLSKSTGRNVLIALALLVFCIGLFNVVLTPMYQNVSAGFVPFDLQFPLTREMIIIQLGAMSGASPSAYMRFAAVDMAFPVIGAALTVLFWGWLVVKSGSATLTAAFQRGWWIWAVFPAVCDLSENVLFLRIIAAHPEPALEAIELAIPVHRGKLVFLSINQIITGGLIVVTLVMRLRRKQN